MPSDLYNFELFDVKRRREPDPAKTPEKRPEIVRERKESPEEKKKTDRLVFRKIIKIMSIAAVLISLAGATMSAKIQVEKTVKERDALEAGLQELRSDKIRLDTELSKKISLDEVEKIAVGEYGMMKVEGKQIIYIDNATDDEVVIFENGEKGNE